VRGDLEDIVAGARRLDLYTNLATSGVPLPRARLERLREAGLDNVQISIQDVAADASDEIAGLVSFERKLEAARTAKQIGFPLTLNFVLHRGNLRRVAEIIALAESLDADRLELANSQYVGWALLNRAVLLPTREQLDEARRVAAAARERLKGRMEVLFVTPDYYAEFPKACMDGWGRRFILISPDGLVLPCHAAHTIPGISFENVRDRALGDVWRSSTRRVRTSPTVSRTFRRRELGAQASAAASRASPHGESGVPTGRAGESDAAKPDSGRRVPSDEEGRWRS